MEKCVRTGVRLTPSHTPCALAWAVGAEEDECNAEQGSGCLFLVTAPAAALRCSFAVSHLETHALAAITAHETPGLKQPQRPRRTGRIQKQIMFNNLPQKNTSTFTLN